ncbi:MAG: hypothetical protein LUE21_00865 [Oscillospiraceae bacterium]|nr:hypothetical protein [Oscillospiraceae bacterium]
MGKLLKIAISIAVATAVAIPWGRAIDKHKDDPEWKEHKDDPDYWDWP